MWANLLKKEVVFSKLGSVGKGLLLGFKKLNTHCLVFPKMFSLNDRSEQISIFVKLVHLTERN
jgi:hypothetical protein